MNENGNESRKGEEDVEHHKEQPNVTPEDKNDFTVPKGYWYSHRFVGSMLAIVLLANNLFIGYSMPANVIGIIDADLGPDPNVYLVTLFNKLITGVGLLLVGSISDVLGRRWFMIGGQALGFIGACMAAEARSINTIIGANIFIGSGGATQVLYPLLVQELVPNKHRGLAQGAIMASVFPTLGLGPAFVRMMVEYTELKWRWEYWLHAITTGLSGVLFIFCYHPPNFEQLGQGTSKRQHLKHVDYVGFALYAGGLVCLLLGLTWGGRQYTWSSPAVIASLVVCTVALIGFGLYETYAPLKSPLFPMNLFKIRNYTVAVVCTTGAALAADEGIFRPFCKKGMRIKLQMIVSVVGLTLFCGIMALGNENEEKLALAMTIVVGLFVGWVELIAIVIAGLVIPPENIGSGQAFFAYTRAVSGTIVTSIYVAIQTNEFSSALTKQIQQAAESTGFPSNRIPEILEAIKSGTSFEGIQGMSDAVVTAVQASVKRAYSSSYSTTYLSSIAWGGLALICCFFATNDVENYFTDFVNKTVDAPHIEAAERNDLERAKGIMGKE
ncbi:hypothetical protein NM208_g1696 [Fusarium decemcellulare]|uniref:Uncharacterized protein n=1 Tax=Fusarium decemcellulare TaxID=57161 RepID=A0ACC1SV03_9HYPO|nr:hypothetical protein NM208_g1696 [Fusarium decemcellulare]